LLTNGVVDSAFSGSDRIELKRTFPLRTVHPPQYAVLRLSVTSIRVPFAG
jgi:hypothetical protein